MVDIQYIREHPEEMKQNIINRQMDPAIFDVDALLRLDSDRRELVHQVDLLRADRNELSSKITGPSDQELITKATKIKEQIQKLEEELQATDANYNELLWKMPNRLHPDIVIGKDEDENQVLREWGEIPAFDFEIKDHLELGEALDIIDMQTAASVSGARFAYIKNEAALLQFALVHFIISSVTNPEIVRKIADSVGNKYSTPFSPIVPPVLMRPDVMDRMGRLYPIEDRFLLEKDDLVLVGSAEHTLGPLHMDQTVDSENLPFRYIGYSTAFRQEAGSYGKDTRGILRVHQFDKLEFETFSLPEDGATEQNLLIAFQEYFLQQLEIPYQVIDICSGDTGKPDYRQVDINSWIPSQNTYRETHTSDYMTDYQAR
ncbi:serine--tRNA ligase, partial [candidate division WWE3 bacterium]|nr:serine--tRNA ligase [candidate division WWE3 bacterium]